MTSEPELLAFLAGFALATNSKLDEVLEPAISFERELRRLFANEPEHSRLRHPFMGLLSVFDIPEYPHTLRARPRTIPTIPDEESGRTGKRAIYIFRSPTRRGTQRMNRSRSEASKRFSIRGRFFQKVRFKRSTGTMLWSRGLCFGLHFASS